VRDIIYLEAPRPTMEQIAERAASHFGVTLADLKSRGRGRKVAWPRHVAMWLASLDGSRSLPQIGRFFGGRDHTTALHARDHMARKIMERHPLGVEAEGLSTLLGLRQYAAPGLAQVARSTKRRGEAKIRTTMTTRRSSASRENATPTDGKQSCRVDDECVARPAEMVTLESANLMERA
jgi:hypothetical protein